MRIAAAVLRGRRAAERLMTDQCTIRRPGALVTDPVTGEVTTLSSLVYPLPAEVDAGNPGRCRVQQTIAQSSGPVVGAHKYTVQDARLDLPVTAGPLEVDDVVEIMESLLDGQMVGRVYRVSDPFHKSQATAQRVRIEEVVG